MTFAPQAAFYRGQNGSNGFTHGVQMGVLESQSGSLQEATEMFIEGLQRANPQIRRQNSSYVRETIGGRPGLTTTLRNVSAVTGEPEVVTVSSVQLRDGSLLYFIGVAPLDK